MFVVAFVIGLGNGLIITKLRVPAFIATLGVQYAIYGAGQLYYDLPPNNSQPIGGLMDTYRAFGTGSIFGPRGIQYTLLIAIVLCVISHITLRYTRFGKQLFAMGSNAAAARVSGIKTDRMTIMVYTIAALLYCLAGYLEVARTAGATVNYGFGYEFDAIVSCTIGGVSFSGGVGTVLGAFAGVIIFTTIAYGMNFIGIPAYYQFLVRGLVIVAAVAIDMRKYQRRS
jgi:methyl-galactoside transport system permease protein